MNVESFEYIGDHEAKKPISSNPDDAAFGYQFLIIGTDEEAMRIEGMSIVGNVDLYVHSL